MSKFSVNGMDIARGFDQAISDEIEKRMGFINAMRGKLVDAWIAETSLLPSESTLCTQTMEDGSIRFWVERRDMVMAEIIAANRKLMDQAEAARAVVLAKLTPEEIAMLGIDKT